MEEDQLEEDAANELQSREEDQLEEDAAKEQQSLEEDQLEEDAGKSNQEEEGYGQEDNEPLTIEAEVRIAAEAHA